MFNIKLDSEMSSNVRVLMKGKYPRKCAKLVFELKYLLYNLNFLAWMDKVGLRYAINHRLERKSVLYNSNYCSIISLKILETSFRNP